LLLLRICGWLFCHRYSSATCPNRRRTCLLLNLPISKSVVRLNATEPAWPNIFQSPCARSIAAAGLGQSIGSPAATPPSLKSKGKATKEVISVIGCNCYPHRRTSHCSLTAAGAITIWNLMAARSDVNRAPYRSVLGAIRGPIFFEVTKPGARSRISGRWISTDAAL
jgi:hypothetical protein